jgi:vacuolar protein sorting-associated protein 45
MRRWLTHAHMLVGVRREVVVDAASDDFYRQHMYNNYGEVGLSVKDMVDKFAAASAQHKQVRVAAACFRRICCRLSAV